MGGQRGSLVLIPGLLCDALLWQFQIAGVAQLADCWVPSPTGSESMPALAADILREVPFQRFALAGLSMGGYIAFEIMRQAPDRVSHLALLDTSPRIDAPEKISERHQLIALAERGRFAGVIETLLPKLVHPDRLTDRALVAIVETMARNVGRAGFVRQQRAIMSRADSVPLLDSIACPTLVLCGREDALTPVGVHEQIAHGIRGARLSVIEHCGHLSTVEQPQVVTRELQSWLQVS